MGMNIWDIMAPAFFECLVLVGIHSYLGLHVLRRKVIFVDLALAQIAALGTTVGFLFGILPGTTGAYWFSLAFTFIGAAVFSISRYRNEKIPQEAIIGLTYAIAAAVVILVIDRAPHGAEHIKEILTGSILWVKWGTIAQAAGVYAVVGGFHFIFRKQFLLISEHPEEAYKQGIPVRFWDFLFYISFGIVITHSVGTAGVLLVFVFLVVPAVASMMITDVLWKQLVIGWAMGLIVSVAGLFFSYYADLPSGPTVVAMYGFVLIIISLVLFVIKAQKKNLALIKISLGIATIVIVTGLFYIMGNFFKAHEHEHEHADVIDETEHMVHETEVYHSLDNMSEEDLRNFLKKIHDIEKLHSLFDADVSDFIHFEIANRLYEVDKKTGLKCYVRILEDSDLPFFREEVLQKVRAVAGREFGYDSTADKTSNAPAIRQMKNWVEEEKY